VTAGSDRGRPRVWPPGTTASDRKRVQRNRDAIAGGHRIDLELSAAAWEALQRLAAPGERAARINQLILDEDARLKADR
jgi:hypothetical protein